MEPVLVREWDNERFHRRVLQLESKGYVARRETYSVAADQDPETGYVMHLYCIEMHFAVSGERNVAALTSQDSQDTEGQKQ